MDDNDLSLGNFQQCINEALADCEWFLLVLTRNSLASDWVRMEVDAAIRLKNQKRIKEPIFIMAGDVDLYELPPLWGVFNIFDATTNYHAYTSALDRTLEAMRVSFRKTEYALGLTELDTWGETPKANWDSSKMGFTCPHCGGFNSLKLSYMHIKYVQSQNCTMCGKLFAIP